MGQLPHKTDDEDGRVLDLERRAVLRLGQSALPEQFWRWERPTDRDAGVRTALDGERAEDR